MSNDPKALEADIAWTERLCSESSELVARSKEIVDESLALLDRLEAERERMGLLRGNTVGQRDPDTC